MSQTIIDLVNFGGGVQTLLTPQTLNATAQGSSFDASNLDVSTNAIVSIGAYRVNNAQTNIQIEESTTGTGSWTVIPNMVCTATTTGQQFVLRGQRTNRYVRANAITVSGTTPSVAASVVLVSQGKFTSAGTSFGSGSDPYPST